MLQYLSWNLLYKNTIPIKFPSKTPQVNINVWPSPWKDLLHPLQLVSWCNKHPRPTAYSPSWDPLVSNRREQLGKTAWSRDRFTHGPNEGQSLYHFWVKASLVPHRKTLEKKLNVFLLKIWMEWDPKLQQGVVPGKVTWHVFFCLKPFPIPRYSQIDQDTLKLLLQWHSPPFDSLVKVPAAWDAFVASRG